MNKYQEALDSFERTYRNVTLDDDSTNEKRDTLQELVDKETPMKPNKDTDDYVTWKYSCPKCGVRLNTLEKQRRCQGMTFFVPRYDEYGCGQKIDWGNESE